MSMWVELFVMLLVILVAAQLFSNALEYLGERMSISSGVTGSIFAAVATALPETTIPILAITAGTHDKVLNQEVSVGAILGAPLMLSTLSTFVMAVSVLNQRGLQGRIAPEKTGFVRDLDYFLLSFVLAALALYLPLEPMIFRIMVSVILILIYVVFIFATFRASHELVKGGHGVITNEPLLFAKLGFKNNLGSIMLQLIIGLITLLLGAKGFIHAIHNISHTLGISALLLSLLIIPIATELPEKVNSIIWVRKNKDTLGFGNITGAMVFQGTILPAVGILLTPWQPTKIILPGILVTIFASLWLRLHANEHGIKIRSLLVNGALYLLYLLVVLK